MSTSSDDGSWTPQGQDPYGQQDPHGQQDAYGQQDPYGQQAPGAAPGQDPWAQPPAQDANGQSAPSAQDPYGQASPYGQPSPYGQASPYGAPSYGQPSAGQPSPYGAPGDGQAPYGAQGEGQDPYGAPAGQPGGEPQSRVLVGILGIFLGGFGVHRFLMGYTAIGVIQIVVTVLTCGLGAWWGLIEGIMVLAKAQAFERDAHGRPLKD